MKKIHTFLYRYKVITLYLYSSKKHNIQEKEKNEEQDFIFIYHNQDGIPLFFIYKKHKINVLKRINKCVKSVKLRYKLIELIRRGYREGRQLGWREINRSDRRNC